MMCRPLVRVASFAVLAFAATAFAGDVKPAKDGWSSYGVGTSVTMKSTTKTTMTMPGAPAMPENVGESRTTLTAKTDKDYTLKMETKVGEQWMGTDVVVPLAAAGEVRQPGAKVEELGDESVTVDGTPLVCKKQKVTMGDAVTTSWTNEKHGVVKSESKSVGVETTMVLTKLAKMVKVAGKDVSCREMTVTSKTDASEMTAVSLMSDAIPGLSVRSESTTKMPASQMTMFAVMEVTAFEIK